MKDWSLAHRSALWFGGLLLVLLLGLAGATYLLLSGYMSRQLDEEVTELGAAASSQLADANEDEARAALEVLVKEGHDLGLGFVLQREDAELIVGQPTIARERPDHVEAWAWRTGAVPVQGGGTLLIGIDGSLRAKDLEALPGWMALIAAVFAGIAALAGWLFGRRMSSLLAEVADTVQPTGTNTPHGAPREISNLVDSINDGFTRAEDARSRSKHLIVGAAHALRSPIQALLSQAQSTLRKDRDNERYRKTLEDQEHELIEFARSVDNLVAFCAESPASFACESFDLMAELRLRLRPDVERARRGEVTMTLEGPDAALVEAERESLVLAVRNLVSNAESVSSPGERVDVRVASTDTLIQITVDDEGPGIPEAERELVFEPMRRGSGAQQTEGGGRARYGLGLALVRRAMEDLGGRAWLEASPSGGARARLEFQAVRDVASNGFS